MIRLPSAPAFPGSYVYDKKARTSGIVSKNEFEL